MVSNENAGPGPEHLGPSSLIKLPFASQNECLDGEDSEICPVQCPRQKIWTTSQIDISGFAHDACPKIRK